MTQRRKWFVGVDWGSEMHQVCVLDAVGHRLGDRSFGHSGDELAKMAVWILEVTGASAKAIHVAIEVPRGPVEECPKKCVCERCAVLFQLITRSLSPNRISNWLSAGSHSFGAAFQLFSMFLSARKSSLLAA